MIFIEKSKKPTDGQSLMTQIPGEVFFIVSQKRFDIMGEIQKVKIQGLIPKVLNVSIEV